MARDGFHGRPCENTFALARVVAAAAVRAERSESRASRERGGFADGHGQTASVKFGLHASFATLSCFNRVDLLLIRMCQVRGIQG